MENKFNSIDCYGAKLQGFINKSKTGFVIIVQEYENSEPNKIYIPKKKVGKFIEFLNQLND